MGKINNRKASSLVDHGTRKGHWPGLIWLMFHPVGRVSREPYWLVIAVVFFVMAILVNLWLDSLYLSQTMGSGQAILGSDLGAAQVIDLRDFPDSNPLIPLIMLATQWIIIALATKRLQDINFSGFFALLTLVPLVGTLFLFGLGFISSHAGPNRYGPTSNSRWIEV